MLPVSGGVGTMAESATVLSARSEFVCNPLMRPSITELKPPSMERRVSTIASLPDPSVWEIPSRMASVLSSFPSRKDSMSSYISSSMVSVSDRYLSYCVSFRPCFASASSVLIFWILARFSSVSSFAAYASMRFCRVAMSFTFCSMVRWYS